MWSAVIGFIIGTGLGSFSKATADRLSTDKSLRGRSYCWHCKHKLAWYDLFPILSYLLLSGRCRYCRKKIPVELFVSEVVMGILIALIFAVTLLPYPELFSFSPWRVGLITMELLFRCFITVVLFIIFWTDLKTGLIFDRVTYPAIVATAVFWIGFSALRSVVLYRGLQESAIGRYLLPPYSDYFNLHLQEIWWQPLQALLAGVVAALFFALLIITTRGRGMGWGDVKYVLLIGLALGFPNIVAALMLAFLFGSVFALVLIAMRKKHCGQTN